MRRARARRGLGGSTASTRVLAASAPTHVMDMGNARTEQRAPENVLNATRGFTASFARISARRRARHVKMESRGTETAPAASQMSLAPNVIASARRRANHVRRASVVPENARLAIRASSATSASTVAPVGPATRPATGKASAATGRPARASASAIGRMLALRLPGATIRSAGLSWASV